MMIDDDSLNPYAAPAADLEPETRSRNAWRVWRAGRRIPTLIALACVAYWGITILLLSSTPGDRFFGRVFSVVACFLTAWTAAEFRRMRAFRVVVSVASAIAQGMLAIWMIRQFGIRMPTVSLVILPTLIITALAVVAVTRPPPNPWELTDPRQHLPD